MHELDNPIHAALRSRHRALAIEGNGERCLRYPADVAPFIGIESDDVCSATPGFVPAGDTVYGLGQPPRADSAWSLRDYPDLAQMVCESRIEPTPIPAPQLLGDAQRADVLELTALVYPHYFRPRTMDLGRYFGIYDGGRLAAIIGERMATDASQEISAVCTHPDFLGRGLARGLLAYLANDVLAQGRLPFLHVSHANQRAKELYLRCGFRLRRDIAFWSLQPAHQG